MANRTPLAEHISQWRDHLLDTSLRNPLLSLRRNAGVPVWSNPWHVAMAWAHDKRSRRFEESDESPHSKATHEPLWSSGCLLVPYPISLLGASGAIQAWHGALDEKNNTETDAGPVAGLSAQAGQSSHLWRADASPEDLLQLEKEQESWMLSAVDTEARLARLMNWSGENRASTGFGTTRHTKKQKASGSPVSKSQRWCAIVDADPSTLQKQLTRLERACRRREEDHGVHTLFLGLGMVEWFDEAGAPHMAPLVLAPVNLHREGVCHPWVIRSHTQDMIFNPSLAHLWRERHGVDTSVFANFLERLNDPDVPLPSKEEGGRLLMEAAKSILPERDRLFEDGRLLAASYARHAMWDDLGRRAETISEHPLVQQMAGASARFVAGADDILEANSKSWGAHDNLLLPLPADASQRVAVARAMEHDEGALIVQGPPGTGKSQTIANLVAYAIEQGRTVLFVAEKATALEVVRKRIEEAGLGDFCLDLHSADGRDVSLSERLFHLLEKSTDLPGPETDPLLPKETDRCAQRLNQSLDFIHTRFLEKEENCHFLLRRSSLHQMMGRWISWHIHTEHPALPQPDARPPKGLDETGQDFWCGWVDKLPGLDFLHDHKAWLRGDATEIFGTAPDMEIAWRALDRWFEATERETGIDKPSALASLRKDREKWQHLGETTSDIERRWLACWGSDEAREFEKSLYAWNVALKRRMTLWKPWGDCFQPSLLKIPDNVLSAWKVADVAPWWKRRRQRSDWMRSASMWTKKPVDWDIWRRWMWAHESVLAAHREVLVIEKRLENLWTSMGGNVLDGNTETLWKKLGFWHQQVKGNLKTLDVSLVRSWALMCENWNDDELSHALEQLASWWSWTERVGCVDEQGARALWRRLCASYEEHERWQGYCEKVADFDLEPLLTWWKSLDEEMRKGIRGKAADIWLAWQSGRIATHVLTQHAEEASLWERGRDGTIRRFRRLVETLDKQSRCLLPAAVQARVRAMAAHPESALLRQMATKRHAPGARKVLHGLPRLSSALMPCMMMSPLGVAEYLPGKMKFDMVIFDEASQITISDAVGAISRGRMIVVVGDEKQMPPSALFRQEEDRMSVLESCLACGVPSVTLNWHYRSKHERLIAFSNWRYYHGRLLTFPDATRDDEAPSDIAETPETFSEVNTLGGGGLWVHQVNGIYDRGGSGTNHEEATAIVERLSAHLQGKANPETIGVITFNQKQQTLIEDLWDKKLMVSPELEEIAGALPQPVMVRNLENAQGDERDIVLFSTTFGKDARGRFPMVFGPLGQSGGERRLNVAITRARQQLEVFTSMTPSDIDLDRVRGQGVKDLRAWLAFAQGGDEARIVPARAVDGAADSPFETAVRHFLEQRGWVVHGQVGCSGYRIDLGVVDPEHPWRYLVGVECDGASYHTLRSARDRDILRQQVLESRGWRLERIWSTDWFADPQAMGNELDKRLRSLLGNDASTD